MEYLASIKSVLSSIFFSLAVLSGGSYTQPVIINNPVVEHTETVREVLGSTISAAADFSTSLASGISSSATTMTLVSLTSGSETLTSGGLYGFKLGGREYVLGYVSTSTSNTIAYMTRGVSRKTGTTTVSAYQSAWGRGTAVEITDAPLLLDLTNKANGVVGYEQPLQYASSVATTTIDDDNRNLVNYELLSYTAFNGAGVINASQTAKGSVEIATQTETASSTGTGSTGAIVAIPASNATSTYNSATAALRVVVTQNNGKIDPYFVATTSLGISTMANATLTGTTTVTAIATSTQFDPMNKIGETILTGNASSITVSSLVAHKDLKIVLDTAGRDSNAGNVLLTFNGDTGNNYGSIVLQFTAANTFSYTGASAAANIALTHGTIQGSPELYILNVANNGSRRKTVTGTGMETNSTITNQPISTMQIFGEWGNTTSQISSVTFTLSSQVFLTGTRLTIYGSD